MRFSRHPLLGVHTAGVLDCLKDALELWVGGAVWVWERAILGELVLKVLTLVDEHGGITSIIGDPVRAIGNQYSARVSPLHATTEEVFALAMAAAAWSWVLKWCTRAPTHLGTHGVPGLDEDTSLDGHVQRSTDAPACERLGRAAIITSGQQSKHLMFGKSGQQSEHLQLWSYHKTSN